jgi:MFS family permease
MTGGGVRASLADLAPGRFERDARLFLGTTFVAGAALSLYWIDFNLYLAALGLSPATIGVVATIASLASALIAFPASALSDRIGRRAVIAGGLGLSLTGLGALLLSEAPPAILIGATLWAAGQQAFQVVQAPFLTEHSRPHQRNELFAAQFAVQFATNVVAALAGGLVATFIAASIGLDPSGSGAYRLLLVLMAGLLVAALATVALLRDDRPSRTGSLQLRDAGEPARFPADPRRSRARLGITVRDRGRFARLVIPGFLISIGAGQVIPFLNVFLEGKFGLDLATLNAAFGITSLGTMIAILLQPRLARRLGQIGSVVLVQGASIPFLLVLGFSPVLWTVLIAMAVRNSLMNASNPVFMAFAMDHLEPAERATFAAATSVTWQVGWVLGGACFATAQATLGFELGYAVNFAAISLLYAIATALYWLWFRAFDARSSQPGSSVPSRDIGPVRPTTRPVD